MKDGKRCNTYMLFSGENITHNKRGFMEMDVVSSVSGDRVYLESGYVVYGRDITDVQGRSNDDELWIVENN